MECEDSFIDSGDNEIEIYIGQQNSTKFDNIIGYIEDILVDEEFQSLQKRFMEKHWVEFEEEEENKLIYTDIFNEYNNIIERHIEEKLRQKMPDFSMKNFICDLMNQKKELDGEVFDMLFTFSDFMAFKEMFLDYKAMKEGKTSDLSKGISITPISFKD